MANIGKYNKRSVSILEQVNAQQPYGNGTFGATKYSKSVTMLPHEKHMLVSFDCGQRKAVKKISDVGILLQAEKYAKIYGAEYLNTLATPQNASPLQQAYDKASDDELLASTRSKYVQRPSEIMAEEYINLSRAEQLETTAESIVRAHQEQQQQQSTQQEGE